MRALRLVGFLAALTGCSTDTFSGADCGTTTFCSTQASVTFCSDFDETGALGNWASDISGTPTTTVTSADFTSCPSSLLVDLPPQALSLTSPPHAWLREVANNNVNVNVTVAFDVKLPAFGSTGAVDGVVMLRLYKDQDLTWHVALEHSGGSFAVRVHQGTTSFSAALVNPKVGAWNHMTLTVLFSADASGSASLAYVSADGKPGNTNAINGANMRAIDYPGTQVTLLVGAEADTATSQDWTVGYDNVVLTTN